MAEVLLRDVTVEYPIYNVGNMSLRNRIVAIGTGGRLRSDTKRITTVTALDHVNLHLKDGDRVGLIGHNGSGKTTLLRTMAGIFRPTHGTITISGRVSTVFGLGAGIDLELSGYENIVRMSLLLGVTVAEARASIPEIEEFTELGDFLAVPVRTYSAGMMTRLAFAVATAVHPEVLLVDEVLGAGDAGFQAKARKRMDDLIARASIFVLASHSPELIREYCQRTVVLSHGVVQSYDPGGGKAQAMFREWVRRFVDRVVRGAVARRLVAEGTGQRLDALSERQSRDIAVLDQREARNIAVWDERMALAENRIASIESRTLSIELQAAALGTALREFSQAITAMRQHANRSNERMHSHLLAGRALSLLGLLSPRDPVDARLARFGRERDGGYILVESLLPEGAVCYSIGISDDVSWDKAMAARGYDIYQYDHTVAGPPESDTRFHFVQVGVGGTDSVMFRPLERMLADNHHLDRRDVILKLDVEGAEWDVLSALPRTALGCFAQIAVEFHLLDQIDDAEQFQKMSRVLRDLRELFVPVHVHANNHVDVVILGGVSVPPVLEVTYVRSDLTDTVPSVRIFPTDLDRPNYPHRSDLFLGRFQFGDDAEATGGMSDRPRG